MKDILVEANGMIFSSVMDKYAMQNKDLNMKPTKHHFTDFNWGKPGPLVRFCKNPKDSARIKHNLEYRNEFQACLKERYATLTKVLPK